VPGGNVAISAQSAEFAGIENAPTLLNVAAVAAVIVDWTVELPSVDAEFHPVFVAITLLVPLRLS
jgi:hypothetical protein